MVYNGLGNEPTLPGNPKLQIPNPTLGTECLPALAGLEPACRRARLWLGIIGVVSKRCFIWRQTNIA